MASLPHYRRIVVGTDGSSLAGPTVERAARLACQDDADLVIVCAFTAVSARDDAKQEVAGNIAVPANLGQLPGKAAASQALSEAMAVAAEVGANVVAALLVDSEPATALLTEADNHEADLIVIGAIHDTSIAGRLLGTVASEVVRKATCEVLIVRPQPGDPEPNVAADVEVVPTDEVGGQ